MREGVGAIEREDLYRRLAAALDRIERALAHRDAELARLRALRQEAEATLADLDALLERR